MKQKLNGIEEYELIEHAIEQLNNINKGFNLEM